MSVPTVRICLFKASYDPFLELLQREEVAFDKLRRPVGAVMNSGTEITVAVAFFGGLVKVINQYLKTRPTRKVNITTKDHKVKIIQLENYNADEVERLIGQATRIRRDP